MELTTATNVSVDGVMQARYRTNTGVACVSREALAVEGSKGTVAVAMTQQRCCRESGLAAAPRLKRHRGAREAGWSAALRSRG
jgi:hypothetical protein